MLGSVRSYVRQCDVNNVVEMLYAVACLPEPHVRVFCSQGALVPDDSKLVSVAADWEGYEYLVEDLNTDRRSYETRQCAATTVTVQMYQVLTDRRHKFYAHASRP